MPSLPPHSKGDPPTEHLSVAIVGNDALVQALPARPIQFAHACWAVGFDVVLPESWGDELVADAALRTLAARHGGPAVFCACPLVRQRLLAAGEDLAPMLITLVAPSTAVARYARALYGERLAHLAYIGDCPAASGPEFDAHYPAREFLALLQASGVNTLEQPVVFEAVVPPDRRRFVSLPGGCPSPEALWTRANERALVGIEGDDLTTTLAQQLLARRPVLVDLAASLGCACCGVTPATPGRSARVAVMSLEPPRASTPVVDLDAIDSLDSPIDGDGVAMAPPRPTVAGSERRPPSSSMLRSPSVESDLVIDELPYRSRPPIAITPPEALHIGRPVAQASRTARAGGEIVVDVRPPLSRSEHAAPSSVADVSNVPSPSGVADRAIVRPGSGALSVGHPSEAQSKPPHADMPHRLPTSWLGTRSDVEGSSAMSAIPAFPASPVAPEARDALEALVRTRRNAPSRVESTEPTGSPHRRNRALMIAIAVLLVLTLLALLAQLVRRLGT